MRTVRRCLTRPSSATASRPPWATVRIFGKLGNDFYKLLLDPVYKNTQKTYRKVVFSTSGTARPVGEKSFDMWNGLQIIDLDIKDEYIAEKLKEYIFNDLCKYHWFLGVCKS